MFLKPLFNDSEIIACPIDTSSIKFNSLSMGRLFRSRSWPAFIRMPKFLAVSHVKIILDKKRVRPKKSEVLKLQSKNLKAKKLLSWKPKYVNRKIEKFLDLADLAAIWISEMF